MRLLILSDLHREVWSRPRAWHGGMVDLSPTFDLTRSRPDAVVLAGDIDQGEQGVTWASDAFPNLPVVYVHGNHEAYGHTIGALQDRLIAVSDATPHVHYLNRSVFVLDDVRFLGTALWTDFRLYGDEGYATAIRTAEHRLNDYRRIRIEDAVERALVPEDTERWHREDVAWLERALAEPFSGKTVVITHMAPSARSIAAQWRGVSLSAAFASSLERLVTHTDLWIHGHTHSSADYRIGRSRVVCNPLGYPSRNDGAPYENPDFDPNFVVEI